MSESSYVWSLVYWELGGAFMPEVVFSFFVGVVGFDDDVDCDDFALLVSYYFN